MVLVVRSVVIVSVRRSVVIVSVSRAVMRTAMSGGRLVGGVARARVLVIARGMSEVSPVRRVRSVVLMRWGVVLRRRVVVLRRLVLGVVCTSP